MAKKVTQARKGLGTSSVGLATELSLVSKLLRKEIPKKIFAVGRATGVERKKDPITEWSAVKQLRYFI